MTSSSTDPREIRKFGLAALVFFGLLAGAGLWRQKLPAAAFFSLPALLGLGFLLLPVHTAPLYRGWRRAARGIGTAATVMMLALAYYLVITPTALVLRLFRRRPLPLKPEPDRPSYWVDRDVPAQPTARFEKRF